MWWNTNRQQTNLPDNRIPVCDVLLPLPGPRAVLGALAGLYKLQTRADGPTSLGVSMEAGARSTLRIRGFRGVDLDALAGCLRAILIQWNPTVRLTLVYKAGCAGALARPEGGVLQIASGGIDSYDFGEDLRLSAVFEPGSTPADLPHPVLH